VAEDGDGFSDESLSEKPADLDPDMVRTLDPLFDHR
jgi:hypothetical protein